MYNADSPKDKETAGNWETGEYSLGDPSDQFPDRSD